MHVLKGHFQICSFILTHCGLGMPHAMRNLVSNGLDNGLSPVKHQDNTRKCWFIDKQTLRSKLLQNFNQNANIFKQEIAFEKWLPFYFYLWSSLAPRGIVVIPCICLSITNNITNCLRISATGLKFEADRYFWNGHGRPIFACFMEIWNFPW